MILRHLTWGGRREALWYALRRVARRPVAAPDDRCIVGSTVDPIVHCPRASIPGRLWCKRHMPVVKR